MASPDDPLADLPDNDPVVRRPARAAIAEAVVRSEPDVAAPRPYSGSDSDVRCVAQAVYHEARGEPVAGQRAVAAVVLNRARTGRWGRACSVVAAPGQFSGYASWRSPSPGIPAWDKAIEIARLAVSGGLNAGLSPSTLFFRAASMGAGSVRFVRIGKHVFW